MNDEPEVEDEDAEEGDFPEETEICAGSFVIHDTARWCREMHALATQVTDEGGVYVVDSETHMIRAVLLDDGKAKSKLTRVQ